MKLITEEIRDVQVLREDTPEGPKNLFLCGTFLQANIPNRNRRFYPEALLEREVARYTQEKIARGCAWGELGHPAGPGLNLPLVSHRITELKKNGTDWIGKAIITNEGMGKIVRGLIDAGGTLGMSSRGLGSLKPDKSIGADVVQDDYHLAVGADIVADPSAPSAFVHGIMENTEWFHDAATGTWAQRAVEPIVETLSGMRSGKIKEVAPGLFEKFIAALGRPLDTTVENDLTLAVKSGKNLSEVVRARGLAIDMAKTANRADDEEYITGVTRRLLGIA